MRFIATCKLGLEALVASELRGMDIEVEAVLDARVIFLGDEFSMVHACLNLRTAERVLLSLGTFKAVTFTELFDGVYGINFKLYIEKNAFIHVTGKSAKSALFSVSDCQSIAKKAIVEKLKASYHTDIIPETGNEIIVEVGILKDEVTIALDCCGAGLSRRGYRTFNVPAPISETLGAALVTLSHYRSYLPLYDPMCGSGTIPIEAAMIANNIAPGLNREFAFERWHFIDKNAIVTARDEAKDAIKHEKLLIYGTDIDPHCIDLCKKHAKKAGIMVNFSVQDIKDFSPEQGRGVIICNPPYGERLMNTSEAVKIYSLMSKLFLPLTECSKHIITAYPDFERAFSKRADKRRKLSNGGLTATLYQYFWKD
ncbi:MAG: class I SAM-dependent RNA methyltransferase [Clostridia bacterium]